MKLLTFKAIEQDGCRDGTYGYQVLVDGEVVIDRVKSGDTDFANAAFDQVYEKLGINVEFDWE